jgi:hypothetical protein
MGASGGVDLGRKLSSPIAPKPQSMQKAFGGHDRNATTSPVLARFLCCRKKLELGHNPFDRKQKLRSVVLVHMPPGSGARFAGPRRQLLGSGQGRSFRVVWIRR